MTIFNEIIIVKISYSTQIIVYLLDVPLLNICNYLDSHLHFTNS